MVEILMTLSDVPPDLLEYFDVVSVKSRGSVLSINHEGYNGAHFATMPIELVRQCVLAGCPEDGIVLDMFMGAGTVGLVAKRLNRHYIGSELNPEYIKIAEERIANEDPLKPKVIGDSIQHSLFDSLA